MYEIRNGPAAEADFTFYGEARDAVKCRASEWMLIGPAETGKTISILQFLHLVACKYPRASIVIMRKTQTSVYTTVLRTFVDKVLLDDAPVTVFGGSTPKWFEYTNGSRIWIAGMDKASRVLSAEHDIIFANQAEEFTLDEWEHLTTRTTGRAGNMPYGQTIGDMNPTDPRQWPYTRETCQKFFSWHVDNPTLYDPETGLILEQGEKTLAVLMALTGARRSRLFEGKAVMVEGSIYEEYNEALHLVYASAMPPFTRYIAGIDWGYRNPGTLQIWGQEGRNGDLYLVAEYYQTLQTDDWWLKRALELNDKFSKTRQVSGRVVTDRLIEAWVCDPSEPAYIEKFNRAGLNAVKGFNAILPGITACKTRFAEDRLFVARNSLRMEDMNLAALHQPVSLENELPGYIWADKVAKEVPVKERDHGCDAMRYVVCYVDEVGSVQDRPAGAW